MTETETPTRSHYTDRKVVAYGLFFVSAVAVASPMFSSLDRRDDFPLSPYGMFSENKDELTTITQAVATFEQGADRPIAPRYLGTDEVLQARATLDNARNGGRKTSTALCEKIAERIAGEGAFAGARRVEIRTVTYESVAYFKDPNVAPKSKKVHARCDVKGKP